MRTITLNDGFRIPQLGFGVFLVDPDDTARTVRDALEVGYRHIDTAAVYRNEEGVGAAVAASGIPRSELYITTKLHQSQLGRDSAMAAFDASLERLGLDYVDLYLIHWPAPATGLAVESWLALEEIQASGRARSIGVSNFRIEDLEPLLAAGSVVPAVNQFESHPIFQQRPLRAFGASHGIHTEVWGPLGQGKYDLGELPALGTIAERLGATLAQVVIAWHLHEGVIVFPKTVRRSRMEENWAALDIELTDDDLAAIRALDRNQRVGSDPAEVN